MAFMRRVAGTGRRVLVQRRVEFRVLSRREPISHDYGFDRGLPVDRLLIEGFLAMHAGDFHGSALELLNSAYLERFGGHRLTDIDVLDIDPSNPRATVTADLDQPGALPEQSYDCIVLTQTLQYLDAPVALRTLWEALRPGGVLLITVPCISGVVHELPERDRARYTPVGLNELLLPICQGAEISVEGKGNLPLALGTLLGLATRDMPRSSIKDADDPYFPVIACARVRKPMVRGK